MIEKNVDEPISPKHYTSSMKDLCDTGGYVENVSTQSTRTFTNECGRVWSGLFSHDS
jgi:hypothetical protein